MKISILYFLRKKSCHPFICRLAAHSSWIISRKMANFGIVSLSNDVHLLRSFLSQFRDKSFSSRKSTSFWASEPRQKAIHQIIYIVNGQCLLVPSNVFCQFRINLSTEDDVNSTKKVRTKIPFAAIKNFNVVNFAIMLSNGGHNNRQKERKRINIAQKLCEKLNFCFGFRSRKFMWHSAAFLTGSIFHCYCNQRLSFRWSEMTSINFIKALSSSLFYSILECSYMCVCVLVLFVCVWVNSSFNYAFSSLCTEKC